VSLDVPATRSRPRAAPAPVAPVPVPPAAVAPGPVAPQGATRPRVWARVASMSLTWRALLASRLLVLVAGIVGSLTLTPHAAAVTQRQARALGAVGHLLAASTDRFDSGYYLGIATTGYGRLSSGRIAFFPVYPELIRVLAVLTRSPVLSGVLISLVSFVVALTLLHRLCVLEFGRAAADATTLLLCFAPLSFFFSAVYTESLFLALTVGAVYAARTDRWRVACLLAVAATLTRPTGFLIAGPLLVLWHRSGRPRRELGWLGLAPVALVAWTVVLGLLGYGLTGEFHVEHTQWHRLTVLPPEGLLLGLLAMAHGIARLAAGATAYHPGITGPFTVDAEDVIVGAILVGCLVALEACRRRMRAEYTVYAALVLVMCLSTVEQGEPLWSFDRFALTIFPLWMVAGAFLARRRWLLVPVCLCGAAALVFYTMQFSSWAFIA
jgi:hypothetical protein